MQQVETGPAEQVILTAQLPGECGRQALAVPLEAIEQSPDSAGADLHAEVVGGDVFQVVRLVQNQPLAILALRQPRIVQAGIRLFSGCRSSTDSRISPSRSSARSRTCSRRDC